VRFVEQKGEVAQSLLRFVHRDGSIRYIEGVRTNLLHEPAVGAVVVNYRDVTARQQAEQALRESEELFRLLFEGGRDAVLWADADSGFITRCNRAAGILFGTDSPAIVGRHQSSLHPPEEVEHATTMFRRYAAGATEEPTESAILRADGERVPVEISCSLTEIGGRRILQGVFWDLRERKRAETERLALERRFLHAQKLEGLGCWRGASPTTSTTC